MAGERGGLLDMLSGPGAAVPPSPAGGTSDQNDASDPRVDAWYAAHTAVPEADAARSGPVGGVWPASGPDSVWLMQQMLQDIPDAGKGSSLGGVAPGKLFNPQFLGGGGDNPSTNNWRLLPYPYQQPGYIMRNGIVINTKGGSYKEGYPEGFHGMDLGSSNQNSPVAGVYSPHMGPHDGYPASYGFRGLNYGWPGALWGWQGGNWDMG